MKYIITLLCILSFSSLTFSDEMMSCKVSDDIVNFKLEENLFSSNKIYFKDGTKWHQKCPCEKVQNKSISCFENYDKNCKKNKNVFDKFSDNKLTVDFETKQFIVWF